MNIAIFGATGFLGTKLIDYALTNTDWDIIAVGRSADKIKRHVTPHERLHIKQGDVSSYQSSKDLLNGIDVAYYFVHMMGHKDVNFVEAELAAARSFGRAAREVGLKRIVYMGGLGDAANSGSRHLKSRHETGEILRASINGTVELRASMIVGYGSVAFDIIDTVARKLPFMVLPKSADTLTQPIATSDSLRYLVAAATMPIKQSIAIDIGGADILSYADVYRQYAKFIGKKPVVIRIPFLPSFLSAAFLNLVTPRVHARIGAIMAESMTTDMVVVDRNAELLIPGMTPKTLNEAFEETTTS